MPPDAEERVEPAKSKQRLVQVKRKSAPASEPATNEPVDEGLQANDGEATEPPPDLHTPFAAVPPDENDPTKRREPTVGLIELTEEGRAHIQKPERPLDVPGAAFEIRDVSDSQLRTLEDIMAAFPIGNGQYFVHVHRQAPATFMGTSTRGILRKLRNQSTLEEFRDQYGGGVYDLIVYGPPKRGGITDEHTGQFRPKALTKPIRIVIPWHIDGGHPPNPDAAYEADDEDTDMTMRETSRDPRDRLPYGLNSRGVTPATANVVKAQLDHDETMDERNRRERDQRRQERRSEEQSALKIVSGHAERREAELMATIDRLTARLERNEQRKPQTDLEGMAKVLQTVNPRTSSEELQSLRDGHQRELDRITQAHRAEVDSLTRRHSEDRSRLEQQQRADTDRAEQRMTEASRRADDRVNEIEKRLDRERAQGKEEQDRQKRDLDAAHEREITFARNEATRSLEAQRLSYENILSSERRNAEREIEMKAQIAASTLATEKSKLEIEIRALKSESSRREKDVEELKRLAEKHKDLGKILEEAKRMAELVGYGPKEEGGDAAPELDWKQVFFHAVTEGAKNLPQILQSAGQAVAQVRNGPQQQASQQRQLPQGYGPPMGLPAPQGPYRAPPQRAFATEASGIEPSGGPQHFDTPHHGIAPTPIIQQQPRVQEEPPPHMQVAYSQPMVAPNQEQMVQAAPAPAPQPQQQLAPAAAPGPTPSTPPPAAPAGDPPVGAYDAIILQAREQVLEPAFKGKQPANAVANFIVQQLGPERVRAFLPTFNPDMIIGAIRRAGVSSGLVTRAGRKYLVAVEAEVKKAIGA